MAMSRRSYVKPWTGPPGPIANLYWSALQCLGHLACAHSQRSAELTVGAKDPGFERGPCRVSELWPEIESSCAAMCVLWREVSARDRRLRNRLKWRPKPSPTRWRDKPSCGWSRVACPASPPGYAFSSAERLRKAASPASDTWTHVGSGEDSAW
jgi:hypothetical protein